VAERKAVTLGTQQIQLVPFSSHGAVSVFACSDRPAVIHSSGRRLVFSNVNLRVRAGPW
jgi:DNA damage-binding protein 1